MATKERPILMSAPMVRAMLKLVDPKSQTRRGAGLEGAVTVVVNNDQPDAWWVTFANGTTRSVNCPCGKPGDRLWVRETWCNFGAGGAFVGYRATDEETICPDAIYDGWKPSIHMKRVDSRITLEVVSVRVERLHDISEADAKAEGIELRCAYVGKCNSSRCPKHNPVPNRYRDEFARLWDSINDTGAWARNPFVWVVKFRPVALPVCQPLPQKSEAVL